MTSALVKTDHDYYVSTADSFRATNCADLEGTSGAPYLQSLEKWYGAPTHELDTTYFKGSRYLQIAVEDPIESRVTVNFLGVGPRFRHQRLNLLSKQCEIGPDRALRTDPVLVATVYESVLTRLIQFVLDRPRTRDETLFDLLRRQELSGLDRLNCAKECLRLVLDLRANGDLVT